MTAEIGYGTVAGGQGGLGGRLRTLLAAFVEMAESPLGLLSSSKPWIVVERQDGDLLFHKPARRGWTPFPEGKALAGAALDQVRRGARKGLELRLKPDSVLNARLTLPAASIGYVEQVVEHRLDRLTPWTPQRVLYGYRTGQPGPEGGEIEVEVAATSQDIAAGAIRRLDELGLLPTALGSSAEPMTAPLAIDLFRGRNDRGRLVRRRRIARTALLVLTTAAVACAASTWASLRSDADVLAREAAIADARSALVAGSGTPADRRQDLALIAGKTLGNAAFALIDRLSAVIPVNTYLDELEIEPSAVRLSGTSADASALIGLLEAKASLDDARFTAPVTREIDGRDRFSISASRRAAPAE